MFTNSKILKLLSFILLFFSIFLIDFKNAKNIRALYAFEEELNGQWTYPEKWSVNENYGSVSFSDNYVTLSSGSPFNFPYIYSQNIFPSEKDFSIEFSIKYHSQNYNYGTGLAITEFLPPFPTNIPAGSEHFLIKIWSLPNNRLKIGSTICSQQKPNCSEEVSTIHIIEESAFSNWHKIKIEYFNNKYTVYLNGSEKFTSVETTKQPKHIWMGNPLTTNNPGIVWPSFNLDYIKIEGKMLDERNPIVLLPGFFGSWNWAMFLYGHEAPRGGWGPFPPVIRTFYNRVYKNLTDTLQAAGYKKNQNLYTYHYNYLASMQSSNQATTFWLNEFIEEILFDQPEGTKVTLIGHSMGGLLARLSSQFYNNPNIDKIITIGSPHKGAIQAYKAWEGGQTDNFFGKLFIARHQHRYPHQAHVIRNMALSLREMIPYFDFLLSYPLPPQPIPPNSITEPNFWLKNNTEKIPQHTQESLITVYGKGLEPQTEEFLVLDRPNDEEIELGIWRDGRPIASLSQTTPEGDQTVLAKSATIDSVPNYQLAKSHNQLISSPEGINMVLGLLEISGVEPVINSYLNLEPALAFWANSPVNIKVVAPDGQVGHQVNKPIERAFYSSDQKFIFIPQAKKGQYTLVLTGTDNGAYEIQVGRVTETDSNWQRLEGNISSNQTKELSLDFDPEKINQELVIDPTGETSLTMAKEKLENLKEYTEENLSPGRAKTRLQRYLDKLIKLINRALSQLDKKNYRRASRLTLSAYAASYRFRLKTSHYREWNQLEESQAVYLRNIAEETAGRLEKSWLVLFESAGGKIRPATVKRRQKNLNQFMARIDKLWGLRTNQKPDPLLGQTYSLAKDKRKKTEEKINDKDYPAAHSSLISLRYLLLETISLLK